MKNIFLFSVLITLIFSSCKRDKDEIPVNSIADYPISCFSNFNTGVDLITDIVGVINYTGRVGSYPTCAVVNIDSSIASDSDTIEIDFGSSNCLDTDGHWRRGRVVCMYNGGFWDSLSMWEIFFYDYYVDDIKLSGVIQVTNNGHDGAGNTSHSISTSSSFERAGDVLVFNSNLLYVRSIGESTPSYLDDVWFVTGLSTNCTTFSGKSFSFNITSPLYRSEQCKYLTKGVVSITPQGSPEASLDYGNGGCDNGATYTVNGNSFSFLLD
ncbi:MAG: hypothetical protein J0L87_13290 [Bacteroidetes bacterium]|nr:hypothetical protein [Bacteroidota bacterium]